MVADGAALLLAGHTHGGQLCVPGYGALVTNCDLPRRQAKGLSTWSADGRTAWLQRLGRHRYLALRTGPVRVRAGGHPAHSGGERVLGAPLD